MPPVETTNACYRRNDSPTCRDASSRKYFGRLPGHGCLNSAVKPNIHDLSGDRLRHHARNFVKFSTDAGGHVSKSDATITDLSPNRRPSRHVRASPPSSGLRQRNPPDAGSPGRVSLNVTGADSIAASIIGSVVVRYALSRSDAGSWRS